MQQAFRSEKAKPYTVLCILVKTTQTIVKNNDIFAGIHCSRECLDVYKISQISCIVEKNARISYNTLALASTESDAFTSDLSLVTQR